jgi:RNA polymerase sigma-70 factor (ECF subfamily)
METADFLESVYQQYHDVALRYVRLYVCEEMAVEDIVSDSFLELWKAAVQNEVERPYSLLITILRHRSLNWLKRQSVKQSAIKTISTIHDRDLYYRIIALEACNPEELFSAEIREIAERTLRTLSPLTYRIFALSRYDNLPVKEIAGMVGLTPKSVEYHITKALKALRAALEGYLALLIFVMR